MKHIQKKSLDPKNETNSQNIHTVTFSFVEFFSTATSVCSQTAPNGGENVWESRAACQSMTLRLDLHAWGWAWMSECSLTPPHQRYLHFPNLPPAKHQPAWAQRVIITAPGQGSSLPIPWNPSFLEACFGQKPAGGGGAGYQAFGNDLNPPLLCFHLIP